MWDFAYDAWAITVKGAALPWGQLTLIVKEPSSYAIPEVGDEMVVYVHGEHYDAYIAGVEIRVIKSLPQD
jgi:hypothetical protein